MDWFEANNQSRENFIYLLKISLIYVFYIDFM